MSRWAIAYDLDVKQMKRKGMTKSEVTSFYSDVRDCLKNNNFETMTQWSIYSTEGVNSLTNAFQACTALKALNSSGFIRRLHLFRVEDLSDLLPFVADRSSADGDPIKEQIEEVFSEKDSTAKSNKANGKNKKKRNR